MSVFFEHFKTLESLVNTIENRPLNDVFINSRSLMSTSIHMNTWSGSDSYEESKDFILNGYKKPLDNIKKELLKLNKQNKAERKTPILSVTGTRVDVPRSLMGLPKAMYKRENTPEKKKTIHLLYGFSALGDVRPDSLIKGGTMFLSLVNALEKQGFRIRIDVIRCTTTSKTNAIGYTCTLKEYNQGLNLLKICYPIACPSMLRRTSFRWCETLPNLNDYGYQNSYGTSLFARLDKNSTKEREFLKKHKVLKQDMYYCNVYEAIAARTVEQLSKVMGITK